MKHVPKLLTMALSIVAITAAHSQSALVYDNQISVVNNGRVNDPSFPVFLMHADGFSLASNAVANEVSWLGAYKTGNELPNGEDDFTILFFAFQAGIPATVPFATFAVGAAERHLNSQILSPYGYYVFLYSAHFPDLSLPEGTYLIAIMNDPDETASWMWADADASAGHSYMMLFEGTPWREASGGGVAEFAFSISYADTSPPRIVSIAATPKALWPPDHRMVPISVMVDARDDRDPSPAVRIAEVRSNEPQVGFEPESEITGPLTLNLRAERLGNNGGRIYTIVVECEDSSGNVAYASVDVAVPHDHR